MRLFQRVKIGRASIKESLDNLPEGICFADQNGMIVLCNKQMHRLCHILMGTDLQHLSELRRTLNVSCRKIEHIHIDLDAVVCRLTDGEVWQFSETEITDADGNAYTQVQAINVTALYEKEAELEQENRVLTEVNARAKNLYTQLDRIVREEENFAIKTHVHDEMGELLGLTRNLLMQEDISLDRMQSIGKRWEQISYTLGVAEQAGDDSRPFVSDEALAELTEVIGGIGVKLVLYGHLPQNGKLAYLLTVAIRECAINTVRHAEGNEMIVELTQMDSAVCAVITNNGKAPDGKIIEGGGLGALRRRIESAGGIMRVESAPVFRLSITLPEKEETA